MELRGGGDPDSCLFLSFLVCLPSLWTLEGVAMDTSSMPWIPKPPTFLFNFFNRISSSSSSAADCSLKM